MIRENSEAVRLLAELVDLMKLDEQSAQSFRVRAYERALTAVRDLAEPVSGLTAAQLQAVDGIGKSTAAKIREYVDTGRIARLDDLRDRYPAELVELTKIPGLGPKTVILLRDRLGVGSVDDLKEAIEAEQLRTLPGMGATSEEKIGKAIERLGLHGKDTRTPIIEALPVARHFTALLGAIDGVSNVAYCGSLRRFSETIGDVDILVASNDPEPVMRAFRSEPSIREVLGSGDTKSSALTDTGLQVDVRVVRPSQFGAALVYFTGSKDHNIELRQRAISRGLILNEYALARVDDGAVVASRTEKALYEALGLRFVEPEMREGSGEILAAEEGSLPRSVRVEDLRGDLHVHSDWSGDGRSQLEAMIGAAAARGLEYVAMTEHAENLAINGLSPDEIAAEGLVIARLGEQYDALTILQGSELNIGPDGSLDYDDEILAGFQWCVASVHSHFDLPAADQTARVIRAMQHPAVNAIGHLTGRRIGRRPGIDIDVTPVLEAAAATGTAIEINSHLDRLDAPAEILRAGLDIEDLVFVISTDAHHVSELANLEFGVRQARRGWVDRARIVNTWPRDRFVEWAATKRRS